MRLVYALLLCCAACGRFEPVDEPGQGVVSGCLVDDTLTPRENVAVFVTRDGAVEREGHTAADGCFSLSPVASGRVVLAANDLHGRGLTEPVRVYAGREARLGRRVLQPLLVNEVMPTLRGVGFIEALAPGALAACRDDDLLVWTADNVRRRLGADGSPRPSLLEVTSDGWVATALERRGGPALRLAEGETCWQFTDLAPSFAVVRGGNLVGPTCASSRTGLRFLTATTEFTTEDADWFGYAPGGQVLRVVSTPGHDVVLDELDASGVVRRQRLANLAPDEFAFVSTADLDSDAPSALLLVIDTVGLPRALLLVQPGQPARRLAWPPGGAHFAAAGDGQLSWLTFARDQATQRASTTSADVWVRFDARARVLETLPAPPFGDGAQPDHRLTSPLRIDEGRPQVVTWSADGLTATLHEHLGAAARARAVQLVALSTLSGDRPGTPTFSLTHVGGGLEVLRMGDEGGLRVLREGAPLESAVALASLAVVPEPICALGGVLFLNGATADLTRTTFRYDVARIADDLLAPR